MNYSVKSAGLTVVNELKNISNLGSRSVPYTALQSSNESLQTVGTASEAMLEMDELQTVENTSGSVLRRIVNCVKENPKTAIGVGIGLVGGALVASACAAASQPSSTSLCSGGQLFLVEHGTGTIFEQYSIYVTADKATKNVNFVESYPKTGVEKCHYRADYQLNFRMPSDTKLFGKISTKETNKISIEKAKGAIRVSFINGTNQISFENTCNIPSGFDKACDVLTTSRDELAKEGLVRF